MATLTLTKEELAKDATTRFFDAANARFLDLLLFAEDTDIGLPNVIKANATLISVTPKTNSTYTAEAVFQIDRLANPIPFGQTAPSRRYFKRKVLIKQTTGEEIAKAYGYNDVLYLDLDRANVPATTDKLASVLSTITKLTITEADIVSQPIPANVVTTYVTFAKSSLSFTGAIRVDLTTPIVG